MHTYKKQYEQYLDQCKQRLYAYVDGNHNSCLKLNRICENGFIVRNRGIDSDTDTTLVATKERWNDIASVCSVLWAIGLINVITFEGRPRDTISSYGLKHIVEECRDKYCSNGLCLVSMVLSFGDRLVHESEQGRNGFIRVSRSDFKLIYSNAEILKKSFIIQEVIKGVL